MAVLELTNVIETAQDPVLEPAQETPHEEQASPQEGSKETDKVKVKKREYLDPALNKRRFLKLIGKRRMSLIPEFDGDKIKELRTRFNVSQTVLAMLLNTSEATVRSWEFGGKKPNSAACKLLHLLATKGLKVLL